MLLRLLAAFILVPLIELILLLQLAQATSVLTTLALVVVTGVIGTILARREGTMAWFRFRTALSEGRMPSREIQDGLMIVFAAALLLTPGLLTDALGFALLWPTGRSWIRRHVLSRYIRGVHVTVIHDSHETFDHGSESRYESFQTGHHHPYTIDARAVHRSD